MGKDKHKDKRGKKGDDKRSRKDGGDKRSGAEEIAKAEKALARALRDVEAAREALARRERELSRLLEKHGRLPVMTGSTAAPVAEMTHEELVDDASGVFAASVPELVDENAPDAPLGAVAEPTDGAEPPAHNGQATDVVPLFDQKQVVREG